MRAGAAGKVPLVDAVKTRDAAAVRTLLKAAERGQRRRGRRHDARCTGRPTATTWRRRELLVRAGANVKAPNRYGVTPIYSAAVNGNAAMIELLLKAGADANVALPEGETALMTAARTGKVDAVKVLLAHGANVNAKETWKQQTALMWAAHEGNAETVKLLLEAGAQRRRSIDLRLDAAAVCRAPGPGRRDQGAARRRRQRQRDAAGRHQRARHRGAGAQLRGRRRPAARHGIDPNAAGQGWTALHQIVWSRRPQRGQNNPGQKPQGNIEQPRSGEEAGRVWRRHQRAPDERAELRHGRAQQPEPLRRDAVLPGRQVVRRADDAGAAGARRRSVHRQRRRRHAADGGGRRRRLLAGREPGRARGVGRSREDAARPRRRR